MKLCLIGDSHVAALKLGWDRLRPAMPKAAIDIFGARGARLQRTALEGRALVGLDEEVRAQFRFTSGGREAVEIDAYDQIVIVGGGLSLRSLVGFSHRFPFDPPPPASLFVAASARHLDQTPAARLARILSPVATERLTVLAAPLPSTGLLGDAAEGGQWRRLHRTGSGARLRGVFEDYLDRLNAGAPIRPRQPTSTVAGGLFTRHRYSRASVRLTEALDQPHPDEDHDHMNGAYGARVLVELLAGFGPVPA